MLTVVVAGSCRRICLEFDEDRWRWLEVVVVGCCWFYVDVGACRWL